MAINVWNAVTKAVRKYNGESSADAIPQGPQVVNNEAVSSVNAAGTGLVNLIKANASNIVQAPNGLETPAGTSLRATGVSVTKATVTTDSTAGALTYTAAMLLGGFINRDPNGGGRSDVTPTAALLVAAIPNAAVGDSFEFTIRNNADAAETITVTAGTGCTLSGSGQSTTSVTIAQNNSKRFKVVLTNVTASSEAYTLYSLGTAVH